MDGSLTPLADPQEARRLDLLYRLGILDTPPDDRFEVFTRLAASVARTPVATISLVDHNRVWFKSSRGLPPGVTEVPRDIAACAHVLNSPDGVLVVPDARLDRRLRDSPLVTSDFGMRFYAGAPLKAPTGEVLGSLCVIDRLPRDPDPQTIQALRDLAEGVSTALRIHEMSALALKDPLTGLGNRRLFEEALAGALEAARRADRGDLVAATLIDLDRFKTVNDTMGHAGGDAVLCEVGQRIARALGPGDVAARLGGDEFGVVAVLGPQEDPAAALSALGTRILEAIRGAPMRIEGHLTRFSASLGVAARAADPAVPTASLVAELMRGADAALYSAKAEGRDRVRLATNAEARGIGSKHTLATDLRRALASGLGELQLVFQPVRPARDITRIAGFEALVRWIHPAYGPILPSSFVPVAERSGLAPSLDAWVLHEACRLIAQHPAPRPTVAVNITPCTLVSPEFLSMVDAAIARHGIAPAELCIEITERVLISELDAVRDVTRALMARGVSVALDDFGAGHASFGHLTSIGLSKVKLDRALTAGVGGGDAAAQRAGAVLRGIIAMCNELGYRVVSEGVETAEQLAALCELGVHEVQGWHTGRPEPLASFLCHATPKAA
jgi:diguanylate cyclase (GGDEF)-like protein